MTLYAGDELYEEESYGYAMDTEFGVGWECEDCTPFLCSCDGDRDEL